MNRRRSLLVLLAGVVCACSVLQRDNLPTPYPTEYLPTVIALTVEAARLTFTPASIPTSDSTQATPQVASGVASPTLSSLRALSASPTTEETPATLVTSVTSTAGVPTITPTLSPASAVKNGTPTRRSTRTPTITPTPALPSAAIQIFNPGPMSKVISPMVVNASLRPGSSNRVRIELLGEDGRLLVRKIINYSATSGSVVGVAVELDFEIAAVAEAARLVISTDDSYGRIVALASVDLVLLSIGENDLNPPGDLLEPVVIRDPLPNTLIQGGVLVVMGRAWPTSSGELLIELVDAKGKVVGYRQASISEPDDMGYGVFTTDIAYEVKGPTWVRLIVSDVGDRPKGLKHVTSLEVLLSP